MAEGLEEVKWEPLDMQVEGIYTKPTGFFKDEEFVAAARQVQKPDLEGWEFFVKCMEVTVHRRYKEESGLYEYKVHGVMADLDPEESARVYVDWQYRKIWDTYVLDMYPVKDETSGIEGLYWAVDYPWPMSDRDYTFVREGRILWVDGERTCVVLARSHIFPGAGEKSGIIRVDDLQQCCAMQSDGNVGSRAYMHYYDNPKGMIPTWLINWAAKTGMPTFLDTMRSAIHNYKPYLEELEKNKEKEKLKQERKQQQQQQQQQQLQ